MALTAGLTAAGFGQSRVALVDNGQKLNEAVGRGVALADFDGNGALDAFVVNETGYTGSHFRVYFGDGRGRFAEDGPQWEYAARAAKTDRPRRRRRWKPRRDHGHV